MNICLKVLSHNKKSVTESFQLKQVPKFSSVSELKNIIISCHSEKFDAPTCAFENLEIGFYGPLRGTRFVRDRSKIRGGEGWCKHGEGHGFSCKHKREGQTIWCMSLRGTIILLRKDAGVKESIYNSSVVTVILL